MINKTSYEIRTVIYHTSWGPLTITGPVEPVKLAEKALAVESFDSRKQKD